MGRVDTVVDHGHIQIVGGARGSTSSRNVQLVWQFAAIFWLATSRFDHWRRWLRRTRAPAVSLGLVDDCVWLRGRIRIGPTSIATMGISVGDLLSRFRLAQTDHRKKTVDSARREYLHLQRGGQTGLPVHSLGRARLFDNLIVTDWNW